MSERDWLERDASGTASRVAPSSRAGSPAPARSASAACSRPAAATTTTAAARRSRPAPRRRSRSPAPSRSPGLGVDLIDPIKEAAEAALGFTLAFDVTDTVTARNKVVTQPDALDIFSGYFNDIDQVWPSGNMAPIPIDQIERWDELTEPLQDGQGAGATRATPRASSATATLPSGRCTSPRTAS